MLSLPIFTGIIAMLLFGLGAWAGIGADHWPGAIALWLLGGVTSLLAIAIRRSQQAQQRETAARAEREARLRYITAQMPAVLWSTDCDLRVTNCLGAGIAPLQLPNVPTLNTAVFELFRLSDQNLLRPPELRRALAGESVTYEVDWHGLTFAVRAEPLRDEDGRITGTIGVAQDITARKQAEEELRRVHADLQRSHAELQAAQRQLIQTAKLEIVGQLAASVAHEVKNPLGIILGGTEYLRDVVAHDRTATEVLTTVEQASQQANGVIRKLLDLATPEELTLVPGNLNAAAQDALALMRHDLTRGRVTIITDLAPDLPAVLLDKKKIEQCFLNFFLNALHAMPDGGTLTVRTRHDDHAVVAEVDDTGHGIPPDKLPRLFEPFFTTKPKGVGTGLGLTTVKNILALHQAGIRIANRPAGGVRVTLTFVPA